MDAIPLPATQGEWQSRFLEIGAIVGQVYCDCITAASVAFGSVPNCAMDDDFIFTTDGTFKYVLKNFIFTDDVTIYEVQQGESTIDVSEYCPALGDMHVELQVLDDSEDYDACGKWAAMEDDTKDKASTAAATPKYIAMLMSLVLAGSMSALLSVP